MTSLDNCLLLEMDTEDRQDVEYDVTDISLDSIITDEDEEEARASIDIIDDEIATEEDLEEDLDLPDDDEPCQDCGDATIPIVGDDD